MVTNSIQLENTLNFIIAADESTCKKCKTGKTLEQNKHECTNK